MADEPFALYEPSYWADSIFLAVFVMSPVCIIMWPEYWRLILISCISAIFATPLLHGYRAQFDPAQNSVTIVRTWFYSFYTRELAVYAANDITSVSITSLDGSDFIALEFRDGRRYSFFTYSAKHVYRRIGAMRESACMHAGRMQ